MDAWVRSRRAGVVANRRIDYQTSRSTVHGERIDSLFKDVFRAYRLPFAARC